jgi:hypothetical protein
MPTTQQQGLETSNVQNIPSKLQNESWGGLWGAAAGMIWPGGEFAQAPQYGGQLTAPQGQMTQDWYQNVRGLQGPDYSNLYGGLGDIYNQAQAGIRDPSQIKIQDQYTPQQFQVNQLQFNDPFAGYNGGQAMQVRAQGIGSTADAYRTAVDQVQAPGAAQWDRISGIQQIAGPQLQYFQAQGPQQVSAPSLKDFQMQAAADVSPQAQVGTQSWNDTGVASSYMSPYMQNVVDTQKQQAQRDYNEQITNLHAQAAKAGAFGGSRQAVVDAEANRDLQNRMAGIQAQGTQQAYQQGQQQFNTQQQLGLQGQQFNVSTGLQAALANQQAQQQANVQNLSAYLQTQGLGAQTGLQAQGMNQNAALQTTLANLQANQATQGLGANLGQQAQLANQQMNYQQQYANQQAGLQANLAHNAQLMQAAQGNQGANLQAGLNATNLGFQGAQFNAGLDFQSQMANQAAQQQQFQRQYGALGQQYQGGMQAGLQAQNLGMTAQQLGMQSNQFGAGLNLQAQTAQQQAQQAAQNANLGYIQMGANLNQQQANYLTQGFQNDVTRAGLQQNAAVNQQNYDQAALDRSFQYWQQQQNFPYQLINFGAGIASRFPAQGATQSTQQGVQYNITPNPSIFNTIVGGLAAGAGAAAMAARGGLIEEPAAYATGGLSDLDYAYAS